MERANIKWYYNIESNEYKNPDILGKAIRIAKSRIMDHNSMLWSDNELTMNNFHSYHTAELWKTDSLLISSIADSTSIQLLTGSANLENITWVRVPIISWTEYIYIVDDIKQHPTWRIKEITVLKVGLFVTRDRVLKVFSNADGFIYKLDLASLKKEWIYNLIKNQ